MYKWKKLIRNVIKIESEAKTLSHLNCKRSRIVEIFKRRNFEVKLLKRFESGENKVFYKYRIHKSGTELLMLLEFEKKWIRTEE